MANLQEDIKEEAKKMLHGINSCHEWEHTERVYNLAVHIGKKEGADFETVALAALLHDIARKEEDSSAGKIDHAVKGALMAKEILEKHGVLQDKIEKICHCIQAHRYRNGLEPQTIEAKVLYDADKLDSMGAIGIGRSFSFAGHIGAKVHNKDADIENTKPYSADDTAWREYMVKGRHLKDKMLTAEGRRMAEDRHNFMEIFFNRINKEVDGEL